MARRWRGALGVLLVAPVGETDGQKRAAPAASARSGSRRQPSKLLDKAEQARNARTVPEGRSTTMDDGRFDQFTKLLATPQPRRGLLKAVGGGLGAALVGAVSAKQAAGAPPPKHCKFQGYSCRTNANCCSLNCCNRTCCGEGQTCTGGQCTAAPPSPPPACPQGQHCSGGRCCDAGTVACPGNPTGCIPAATACSGEPVCCSTTIPGAIVCGFQGQCPSESSPPPATCPPGV